MTTPDPAEGPFDPPAAPADTPEGLEARGFSAEDPDRPDLGEAEGDLKRLLERASRPSQGWLPKPGDKLYGEVLDVDMADSEFGEYPLIEIETPAGSIVDLHCFHTVLKRAVERKIRAGSLVPGAQLAVVYFGEAPAQGGKSAAHLYRIQVGPPPAAG